MNQLGKLWHNNLNAIVVCVKIVVLIVGGLWFSFGCGSSPSTFDTAIQNENFEGAKKLVQDQIRSDWFPSPKDYARAQAHYKIAYVFGKLSLYDSMKVELEIAVKHDANFSKGKRQMIEYFSLDEFNKAVSLYNNFFFDKAIAKLKTAIDIVGTESPYEEYSAIIYRCLAYAEASNHDIDAALKYCNLAAQLGDALSKKILTEWDKEKKISPPEKLEPREKPSLTI